MPNYRLTLTFEGTAYHGWQRQKGWPTVQQTVEMAIAKTVGAKVSVRGCGRTDAGVHAEKYVAVFNVASNLPPERMMAALNSRLPEDVAVLDCDIAPDDFHPTAGVTEKVYRYTIATGNVRPVIERNFVHWVRTSLDVDAMTEAAQCLIGEHDFASFVTDLPPGKNTVRTLHRLDVDVDGRYVTVTVSGNGFLYNMVRAIVGCLIVIGQGRLAPRCMQEILDARDRTKACKNPPARGLTMVRVVY